MNPEKKAKWVAALRSDKYKQGRSVLRYNDEFCCLGVLCDLAEQEGVVWSIGKGSNTVVLYKGITDEYGSDTTLPESVVEWAGLNSPNPIVAGDYLANWNDLRNASFDYIANLIEQNL